MLVRNKYQSLDFKLVDTQGREFRIVKEGWLYMGRNPELADVVVDSDRSVSDLHVALSARGDHVLAQFYHYGDSYIDGRKVQSSPMNPDRTSAYRRKGSRQIPAISKRIYPGSELGIGNDTQHSYRIVAG